MFIGPQGCGKGTQSELLSEEFNMPVYSTGELLREEKRKGSKLGKKIAKLIDNGILVPADLIYKIIKEKIKNKEDYIIDGFPRNISQVKIAKDIEFDKVFLLNISDKIVLERLSGRETCKNCGSVYHVKLKKSKVKGKCDKCNGELYIRDDDKEEAIKQRLKIYKKETMPVVEYYRKKGVLVEIDASRSIKEIYEDVRKIYKENNT